MNEENLPSSESLKSLDDSLTTQSIQNEIQLENNLLKELLRLKDTSQYRMTLILELTQLNQNLKQIHELLRKGLGSIAQQIFESNKIADSKNEVGL